MKQEQNETIIMLKEDVAVLNSLLEKNSQLPEAAIIREKIAKATILDNYNFPRDVARLNTVLTIRDKVVRQNFQYALTVPEPGATSYSSDSIFRPLGAALLGMRTGDELAFPTQKGTRYFFVMEMENPVESIY